MTPDTADMSLSCHYAAAPHEAQAQAQPATNLPRPAPTSRCCLYPPKQEADEDGSGELDPDEFYEKLGPYLGQSLSQAEVGAGRRRRACCRRGALCRSSHASLRMHLGTVHGHRLACFSCTVIFNAWLLPRPCTSHNMQVAQLFMRIDADCGGTIDWEEFVNYFFLQRAASGGGEGSADWRLHLQVAGGAAGPGSC